MPTVRLLVTYDGTGLSGWQRQRGVPTVQEELERAASGMCRAPVRIYGAGRTDAGVHALLQVATFRTEMSIPSKGWVHGLTAALPHQIAVLEAREVPDDYDPRRASAGKRYRYLVHRGRLRDPFLHNRAWLVHDALDLDKLREEATALPGWHDFRAFRAADCERENTERCLYRVALLEGWAGRSDLLAIEVEGTAFLKNMVRILAGTLIDVARGRLPLGTVRARFEDKDRTRSGITAPAHGLYLAQPFVRDEYRLEDDSLPPRPPYADAYVNTRKIPANSAGKAPTATEGSSDERGDDEEDDDE